MGQLHGTKTSLTVRSGVLYNLEGHAKKFILYPKCDGKLLEGILARWNMRIPFGCFKAHHSGQVQNGLEEAIWRKETSKEPVVS